MWSVLTADLLTERQAATIGSWLAALATLIVIVCGTQAVDRIELVGQAALLGYAVVLLLGLFCTTVALLLAIYARLCAARSATKT